MEGFIKSKNDRLPSVRKKEELQEKEKRDCENVKTPLNSVL